MKNMTTFLEAQGPIQPLDPSEAKREWNLFRGRDGVQLLTPPNANMKLGKSAVPSYGLSLAPADASGVEVCNYRTDGCTKGCVAYSGKWGNSVHVQTGRWWKTAFLSENPPAFVSLLSHEIKRAAEKHDGVAVRLNAFSDLPWERIAPWLFDTAAVQFYDYTKWPIGSRRPPSNYDLTTSVSESWSAWRISMGLREGHRLAMVVPAGREDYTSWRGFRCVNGDVSDARWEDPTPSLVLLKAKGRMRGEAADNPMVRDLWKEDDDA